MMDSIFEALFQLLFKFFRFVFMNVIFEILFEGLIRSIGYAVVRCYRCGQRVNFDSTEVCVADFLSVSLLIALSLYFLLR